MYQNAEIPDVLADFDAAMEESEDKALEFVKSLVQREGTATLFVTNTRDSILCHTALRGHIAAVQWLLDSGADPEGDCNDQHESSMLAAVSGGSIEIVRLLVEKGVKVNVQDVQGDTPLLRAVNRGRIDLTRLLLEAGADPTISNVADVNPLNTRMHAPVSSQFTDLFEEFGYQANFRIYEKTGMQVFEEWAAKRRAKGDK